MPTHPARARKLISKGRAVPHHIKGMFGIRLLDRTRVESDVQDVAINIHPGSQNTGYTVVTDDEKGQRIVLAALEIKHRAFTIKATLVKRRGYRRTAEEPPGHCPLGPQPSHRHHARREHTPNHVSR